MTRMSGMRYAAPKGDAQGVNEWGPRIPAPFPNGLCPCGAMLEADSDLSGQVFVVCPSCGQRSNVQRVRMP